MYGGSASAMPSTSEFINVHGIPYSSPYVIVVTD